MKRLTYHGGRNPFENIEGFVAHLRKTYPGISDLGVNQIVKRVCGSRQPRIPQRIVTLFGSDIMTADLEKLPAWPYLAGEQRQRLQEHPMDRGERINDDDPKLHQLELVRRLDRSTVNRSALVSPRGLERTYVWSAATDWTQEVSDRDYDLILSFPDQRRIFQDPDIAGPYIEVRSYQSPVIERYQSNDIRDLETFVRERTRRPQWVGTETS